MLDGRKGDYDGAMRQYLRTIGRLEPSYVIRKFLDAQRIHNLTSYLQVSASWPLNNLFTDIRYGRLYTSKDWPMPITPHFCSTVTPSSRMYRSLMNSLRYILLDCKPMPKVANLMAQVIPTLFVFRLSQAGSNLKFEVKTAIRVCRQAGYFEHALYLAKVSTLASFWIVTFSNPMAQSRNHHEQALKIMVEDLKDYQNAITYIATLNFAEVLSQPLMLYELSLTGFPHQCEKVLKKYGKNLVTCMPEQTTNLLMNLCTNYKPKGAKGKQICACPQQHSVDQYVCRD